MNEAEWKEYRRQADNDESPEVKTRDVLVLLNERDTLRLRLEDLIKWIDERKFERIHKFCGCTYCNARAVIGKGRLPDK